MAKESAVRKRVGRSMAAGTFVLLAAWCGELPGDLTLSVTIADIEAARRVIKDVVLRTSRPHISFSGRPEKR
jgi:hypothetical protein